MKILKRWLIPLQIVFLLLQPVITLSSNITCSAGIATLGSPTKITCNFDRNIGSPKLNFVIWRFPLDTQDLDDSTYRKDVLSCNWLDVGGLNCRTTEGYEFNQEQTVITTANVDIPSATADQEGIYKCLLVTQEIIPTSPCNLTVEDREGNQVTQDIEDFVSDDLTLLGAFILIVGILVCLIISLIVITFYCRKYTCLLKNDQNIQTSVENAERCTNTITTDPVVISVDTSDLAAFVSANEKEIEEEKKRMKREGKKKEEKKTPSKQSTPKHSQEDLTKKEEEKQRLLPPSNEPATALQYGPQIPVKDPRADHSPDDGQPTQEAGRGDAATEAGNTMIMETSIDIDDPDDTTQDTTQTDHYMALNEDGNNSDGKHRKKGILSFLKKL